MEPDPPAVPSDSFVARLKAYEYSSPGKRPALHDPPFDSPPAKKRKIGEGRYKKGVKKSYQPPEVYAHLPFLPDKLAPGLDSKCCCTRWLA
jgi:hypothetical protein